MATAAQVLLVILEKLNRILKVPHGSMVYTIFQYHYKRSNGAWHVKKR